MFNGIITHTGKIKKLYKNNNNCILEVQSKIKFKSSEIGSSISCSGACLTLEKFNKNISKTIKEYKLLTSEIKNSSIPMLKTYEKNYDLSFSPMIIKKFYKFKNIVIIGRATISAINSELKNQKLYFVIN